MRRPLMICFLLLAGLLMTSAHTTAFARSGKKHSRSHNLASYRSPRATLASNSSSSLTRRSEFDLPRFRPWGAQAELFGRGGLYSLNLEYSFMPQVTLGAGLSYLSYSTHVGMVELVTIPMYANYYPFKNTRHRALISGGASVFSLQFKANNLRPNASLAEQEMNFFMRGLEAASTTLLVPSLGGGYEFRAQNGFLFRSQIYVTYTVAILPTLGLSVGYNF